MQNTHDKKEVLALLVSVARDNWSSADFFYSKLVMMRPVFLLICLTMLLGNQLFAQKLVMVRQIHQSFELREDVEQIRFDLPTKEFFLTEADTLWFVTNHVVEAWAGNTILVETTVTLTQGTEEILDFFVKEGRYAVQLDTASTTPTLNEVLHKRNIIKTKNGICGEEILFRVLVPDTFEWEGLRPQSAIKRKED